MSRQWLLEQPRVLDVTDAGERVRSVVVALVAGSVTVVADEASGGTLDVAQLEGLPLRVSWDGRTLRVLHGKHSEVSVLDTLKRVASDVGGNRAVVTLRVPAETKAVVSTVSGSVTVTGLHRPVTVNTFSGRLTLDDVVGKVTVNTVTGAVSCSGLHGPARLVSVSGSVTVTSSELPEVRANTVSGALTLDLTNGRADVSANTLSGNVTVRAPFTGYAVTANSATGSVVVDGQPLGRTGSRTTGANGTLRAGDESLTVHAYTASGTVTVVRSGGSPQDAPRSSGPQDATPEEWWGS